MYVSKLKDFFFLRFEMNTASGKRKVKLLEVIILDRVEITLPKLNSRLPVNPMSVALATP